MQREKKNISTCSSVATKPTGDSVNQCSTVEIESGGETQRERLKEGDSAHAVEAWQGRLWWFE